MASESPYWNPKTETLPRERLEALQLAKLRRQCAWALARSPWYQRHLEGLDPSELRSLTDLRRLPFLTRDEWMASQEAQPPYGEIPTVGGEGAIRVHTTSGTTGGTTSGTTGGTTSSGTTTTSASVNPRSVSNDASSGPDSSCRRPPCERSDTVTTRARAPSGMPSA